MDKIDYITFSVDLQHEAWNGSSEAQYKLGLCCLHAYGIEENLTKAVKWLRLAADQDYARAQYQLGQCYELGKGIYKYEQEAIRRYKRAAELGLP